MIHNNYKLLKKICVDGLNHELLKQSFGKRNFKKRGSGHHQLKFESFYHQDPSFKNKIGFN